MTAQVILNGLVTGMVVALPAVALTLIYGILKFPNFAIGAMLTVGAYLALALNVYLSLPVLYAAAPRSRRGNRSEKSRSTGVIQDRACGDSCFVKMSSGV